MRSYGLLMAAMAASFLALFGLAEALELPLLTDPDPWLSGAGSLTAAAVGFGLLVVDVFLPVPSSLVMIAHGALFGIVGGALLSLAGGTTAAAVGFALGRWGRAPLRLLVPEEERRRADALLGRWGNLAVVVTRPVPILAESVAILAGTSRLPWRRFLPAAALGNLPACLLYAATGATALRLDDAFLTFGLVLLVAALVWLWGRRLEAAPDAAAGTPRLRNDPEVPDET
ncbi:MAG TPA: VTT domain-containing protein [Thermoanaerobaculia bacterium]|nr:VTT domain-containing protein [Thermoanaerobaculia bacterium]